jgi:hypothetical protein
MNSNNETTTAPPETAGFDVREFARTAHGSHRGTLDLGALAKEPLDAESVRLVRALRDMERATLHRVRDLLVTATHKDARVTAFLTTWMFERFWIAGTVGTGGAPRTPWPDPSFPHRQHHRYTDRRRTRDDGPRG